LPVKLYNTEVSLYYNLQIINIANIFLFNSEREYIDFAIISVFLFNVCLLQYTPFNFVVLNLENNALIKLYYTIFFYYK